MKHFKNFQNFFLTTEGGSLFEGSSGEEELSCSIPGGVALIRSVFLRTSCLYFWTFSMKLGGMVVLTKIHDLAFPIF